MKKYILISAGIILSLLLFSYYGKIRLNYTNNFLEIYKARDVLNYERPYSHYIMDFYFEYPQTYQELLQAAYEESIRYNNFSDYGLYENKYFKDLLSRETPGFLQYIPLYNRDNMKREGFMVLSAGIDGKINNKYEWNDTLFVDDFLFSSDFNYFGNFGLIDKKNMLKLYPPKNLATIDIQKEKPKVYFNIFNYFFGNKDILVGHGNLICDYLSRLSNIYNLGEMLEESSYYFTGSRTIWGYKGNFAVDTIIENERYIFFRYEDYLIRNKLYDGRDLFLSDTIKFIGTVSNFDSVNKIIDFVNCIQIDKEIDKYEENDE
jgi:hypothetical protein